MRRDGGGRLRRGRGFIGLAYHIQVAVSHYGRRVAIRHVIQPPLAYIGDAAGVSSQRTLSRTNHHRHLRQTNQIATTSPMAPKPASTAGKAPASTASKAPAKTTADKAAKKTSKKTAPADGEKKKRKRLRKETYSSYIYKGERELGQAGCVS